MKSIREMSIEELGHMSIRESKKLPPSDYVYLLEKLVENKIISNSDIDLIFAMEMVEERGLKNGK